MEDSQNSTDKSKLWLVRDYPSAHDPDSQTAESSDPEKVLLDEWHPDGRNKPGPHKAPLGIIYDHPGAIAGFYPLPIVSYGQINSLLKKLLTFVEATVGEKEQKDATKKLITRLVWDHHNEITKDLERKLGYAKQSEKVR